MDTAGTEVPVHLLAVAQGGQPLPQRRVGYDQDGLELVGCNGERWKSARRRVQEVDAEPGKAFGRPGPLGSADKAGAADGGGSHSEVFEQ